MPSFLVTLLFISANSVKIFCLKNQTFVLNTCICICNTCISVGDYRPDYCYDDGDTRISYDGYYSTSDDDSYMYITVGKPQVCVDDTLVYLCEDIVDQSVADRFCYSNQSMHCLCCVLGMIIIVQLIGTPWELPFIRSFNYRECSTL